MVNDVKVLARIKEIEMLVLTGADLSESGLKYLLHCLGDEFSDAVHTAALLLLTESDDYVLDVLIERYDGFCERARLLMLNYLASTDYVQVYVFLLRILKRHSSLEEVNVVVLSLANTHYFVLPLILIELNTDNKAYLGQLKRILYLIGLDRLQSSLAVMPQIPHEAVFRELFGAAEIDRLKSL